MLSMLSFFKKSNLFSINGYNGTRKTFLWLTIINQIYSEGLVFFVVASSKIILLLLSGGKRARLRFKIPLNMDDNSTCEIEKKPHNCSKIQ
jgi:hypothetical protein